ncbi:hypothetical protein [Natronomonas sp. LN261]|jgi:hypothetical protein|uniref:hypothetical protein n=1 Tax=Natronomonas sp. LN261 TaxID=2750669 RepID=UPI0015EF379E|nr:hypothetical protein [Natronomonas sp. LN261]
MSAVPGGVDTARQPPMTVPLRHFVVGLGFLLVGTTLGIGAVADVVPGRGGLVHVHFLLAGWICITIMGAMTQFVPVWSNATLHSRRLANAQLGLVATGLLGFGITLSFLPIEWLVPFGFLMLVGFWTFAYNIARTLATVDSLDVTERHFAFALACFLVLTVLGFLLAINLSTPVLSRLSVTHTGLLGAHVTVAVFGAVMTTVYGALYQLGTMFTQTELHGIDHHLRHVEEVSHPLGVVVLAAGRLFESSPVATLGGLSILLAALALGAVLLHKLYEMRVERTPMHTRYIVVVSSLTLWAIISVPAWISDPIAPGHRFGAAGSVHLLVVGVIGFVVLGTLYHIIPFILWVHTYSDRLGFEDVPMIDDLYDDRLAAVDGTLLFAGTVLLVVSEWVAFGPVAVGIGGALFTLGVVVFTANMLLVLRRHSPDTLDEVVFGSLSPRRERGRSEETVEESPR